MAEYLELKHINQSINYCIRVTALVECFNWTWNKQYNRTRGVASAMLSMPNSWGSTFGTISFYYDLIFKGHVPLNHYWN